MPKSGTRAFDAGLDQRERQRIAAVIVGLVSRVLFEPEAGGVDVGARAGEQDAVDGVEQRADIGDLRRAGEHQRQRADHVRDRAQIPLADKLRRKAVLDDMHVADDADDRFALACFGPMPSAYANQAGEAPQCRRFTASGW